MKYTAIVEAASFGNCAGTIDYLQPATHAGSNVITVLVEIIRGYDSVI